MDTIYAAEIKKRGVSALEPSLEEDGEAIISVRGKDRYVVMNIEKYSRLRELELDQAVKVAREDHQTGRTVDQTLDSHMRRVSEAHMRRLRDEI